MPDDKNTRLHPHLSDEEVIANRMKRLEAGGPSAINEWLNADLRATNARRDALLEAASRINEWADDPRDDYGPEDWLRDLAMEGCRHRKQSGMLICEAAEAVLRETGNPAVMYGDSGLLHAIANRAGSAAARQGHITEQRVLDALARCPGNLVATHTSGRSRKRVRIFYLPEFAPAPLLRDWCKP